MANSRNLIGRFYAPWPTRNIHDIMAAQPMREPISGSTEKPDKWNERVRRMKEYV